MKKLGCLFIFSIFLMSMVSAAWYLPWTWWDDPINNTEQEGKLYIINNSEEWNVLKSTGEESELTFWTVNAKDKKTEIGWIPKSGNCSDWEDKYLYNDLGNRILDDKDKDI